MILEKGFAKKILIVTSQALPQTDQPATGGGIRAYSLGEALKTKGHTIQYSIPMQCCCEPAGIEDEDLAEYAHSVKDLDKIVEKSGSDIILFCNWGLATEALECDIPVVIDMNGSLVLENYYRNRDNILDDSLAKILAIAKADFLIAGSEGQKKYLTSWCLLAGLKPEDIAIGVVPFSLSPLTPKRKASDSTRFILAGYDWPWLDGNDYIQTVCNELEKNKQGELHVYSSKAPYVDIFENEDSTSDAEGQVDKQDRNYLKKYGPVDFKMLTQELCKATAAIDLWQRNPERELAMPSRVIAYLWAGLPVISVDYGEMSHLIKIYKAGWVVENGDNNQISEVINKILVMDVDELNVYRNNALKLFSEYFSWEKTIDPLDQFCKSPKHNRVSSSLTSKFYYYQRLSEELHNFIEMKAFEETTKKKEYFESEYQLMSRILRRPKGFTLMNNPRLFVRKFRRTIIGVPVLFYLTVLTVVGHYLHRLQQRMGKI